jgi:dihydropteroate synthase
MTNPAQSQIKPARASSWRLKSQVLEFGLTPLLMGIVNVTPDSFSDGGRFFAVDHAIDQAMRLAAEGAHLIDVGGESTRPYSTPVPPDEELRRVLPVVEKLAQSVAIPISIDTSKAAIADATLSAGAEIINDVTGLEGDPEMLAVARRHGAGVCVMHMQGNPQTMQDAPEYQDVVEDIFKYLQQRAQKLLASGIDRERICLDPGIGFGKTHQHNLTLIANLSRYHALGFPILAGHSRKGFVGKVLGDSAADRTFGTLGASLAIARHGVQILRVHDIKATKEALEVFAACGGIDGRERRLP